MDTRVQEKFMVVGHLNRSKWVYAPPPRCVLGQVPSFSCPGSPLPLTQNRRHGSFSWGSGGFAAFPFHFAFFMDVYFEKAFVRQSCISKTETKSLKRGRKEGREGVAGVACRY